MDVKQLLKETVRRPAEAVVKVYLSTLPSPELRPEAVRRILVFAYHGLGNFIMYTPALRVLRERYPDARIDLQVGNDTGCEEVLAGSGLFDLSMLFGKSDSDNRQFLQVPRFVARIDTLAAATKKK